MSDDDIAKEMAEGTAWLDNRDVLQKYLHLDEPNWKDPDSQWGHPTDGSVFTSMRKAAQQWLASQAEGGGQ
ncbi:MAG: hypothetical protein IMZ62_00520 [Chloroflexi bacterium]|nr:hypothetical protein [Chloroflexota bacterium]